MQRPRVQQLDTTGVADGQVVTYVAALGYPVFATPVAITTCRLTLVAAGGESVLNLGVAPIAGSERVFVGGALKVWGGVDYTLVGSVVIFASPLSAGARIAVFYSSASACGIASLTYIPTGFTRPVALSRPIRRYHRIR